MVHHGLQVVVPFKCSLCNETAKWLCCDRAYCMDHLKLHQEESGDPIKWTSE